MFKNLSISKKIFYPLLAIAFISTIIFLYTSYSAFYQVKKIIIKNDRNIVIKSFKDFIESQKQLVLTSAIILANNEGIGDNILLKNKLLCFQQLEKITKTFYKKTEYKNLRIKIFNPDLSLFVKSGEMVTENIKKNKSFSLSFVRRTKHPIATIELDDYGLAVKGIAPIFANEEYVGNIEVIIDFNCIIQRFPQKDLNLLILVNKKYLKDYSGVFQTNFFKLQDYFLAVDPNLVDLNFYNELKKIDLSKINIFNKAKKTFIVSYILKDFFNKPVGCAIIGKDIKLLKYSINEVKVAILKQIIVIGISSIVLFTIILLILTQEIVKPIKNLTIEIGEGENNRLPIEIEVSRKDEIGRLAKYFNKYIQKINDLLSKEHKISQFRKLIEDDSSLEDVYQRIEHLLINYFKINKFIFYEINPSGNRLIPVINRMDEIDSHKRILANADLCRAKRLGRIVTSEESFFDSACFKFQSEKNRYHICLPLITGEGVKNILFMLADSEEEFNYIKEKVNELNTYLENIAPVLETKRLVKLLKKESITDTLTGFYNRRFLDSYLTKAVAMADRTKSKIGILMIDIDFFKKVNDKYGHDVGDIVLREISHIIRREIRESDIGIRFGGEEFLIILNNITDENEMIEAAERIRQAVENQKIKAKEFEIRKTISIGCSIYDDDEKDIWKVIKFSDIALYEAKKAGRNKVVRFHCQMCNELE